ncbi:hypothetical protein BD410DRAFT_784749 [Rickenella mellea]|uniref:DNA binding protein Ncp1 n=1 Tax=Rickenella mellea TaxID=50990 RepID=A0A4Y7QDE8_9AGAM|nr:hypothetical protein BD410DRAFT_784749 [Rickenella mellea]
MNPSPATEKSVYFDARRSLAPSEMTLQADHSKAAEAGADVNRQPSVAVHEPTKDIKAVDYQNGHTITGAHDLAQPSPAYEATEGARSGYMDAKVPLSEKAQSPVTSEARLNGSSSPTSASPTSHERISSGAFSNGPGTTGPASMPQKDDSHHARLATAESGLDDVVKGKITKEELKNAKRMSKIIKNEAKSEKKSFDTALKELAKIQKLQKHAADDENSALKRHARALKAEHKANMKFLAAKQTHEKSEVELRTAVERLDACKDHALKQTELLQQKNREVEEMRSQKAVDDREREARLKELADMKTKAA